MKVNIVSYSQLPKEEVFGNTWASDATLQDLVAYCARVSNPDNQMNTETADRLVKYLIRHKHWSPLEMVSLCLEVETTRDIARQLLRHRSFSFQEFSQRYADPAKELEFVTREARLQDPKNRQNSVATDDESLKQIWNSMQKNVIDQAQVAYRWAIDNGIAKEQARSVLPEGLTHSRLYVNGTLRSWVHYIELRSANGTQQEHIELAKACATVINQLFPLIDDYVGQDIA
jgi:thymidylate synthase (FAD)